MVPLKTSRLAKEAADPAGQMRSQRAVLLARHGLYQGYRGGAPGCIIDHEDEVPLARDHAVVVHALTGGRGVVVLSSGDEGSAFGLPGATDKEPALKAVASAGVANWNKNTTMLSLLLVLS